MFDLSAAFGPAIVTEDEDAKPERFMQIDEKMEVSISGVGTLSNVIRAEPTHPRTVGCC